MRSRLPPFFLAPTAVTGRSYATPHPIMSISTGQGATDIQAPYLFTGAASGPQNLLHHDTVSGYGLAMSFTATTCHHHDDNCTNARTERKARNREHVGTFFFYFRTSKCCNSTPPFAYYKREGRDPRQGGKWDDTTQ
jgi:hypothetical protein